jgi:hypothetical protein
MAGKRARVMRPMTLDQLRAQLRALDENIADMLRTSVRIGERYGWDSDLHLDISTDIARWIDARGVLAMKLRAMRAQKAA